jgi:hypothetical protein
MSIGPKGEEELKYQSIPSQEGQLKDKKVLVIVTEWGGYGDASCSYKIMRYLTENGIFKTENLAWINTVQEFGDFFDPQHQFKAKSCHIWDVRCDPFTKEWNGPHKAKSELIEELKKEGFVPDLILIGPAYGYTSILDELEKLNIPIVHFLEYGHTTGDPKDAILGVRDKQMGIHIDRPLLQWSEKEHDVAEKLKELENLPEKLQVAILGKPYSEDAVKEFQAKWRLFFSYASGALGTDFFQKDKQAMVIAYAKMAYQYEKTDTNLCLFFMGQSFTTLPEEDLQELRRLGVAKISWPLEEEEIVLCEKGKEIKIINSILKPEQVPILLKASEDEVLTTGDQFFSECVSSQKHFIYQTLPHKKPLLMDLEKQASQIDEEFGKLFTEAHTSPNISKGSFSKEGVAKLLYQGRVNKKMAKAWREFTTHLCRDCAFGPRFTSHIKDLLQK